MSPVSRAVAGPGGVALAVPRSRVVALAPRVRVVHAPLLAAVAGPGGIAHAQADLAVFTLAGDFRDPHFDLHELKMVSKSPASVAYLPYYGGARGQYLEVKRDEAGAVLQEAVVAGRGDAAGDARELDTVLRALGGGARELLQMRGAIQAGERSAVRERYRSRLVELTAMASRLVRLVEKVGDNADTLLPAAAADGVKNDYEEDVGEEGIGISAPAQDDELQGGLQLPGGLPLEGVTIAEAKPFGLAVVGEHGVASSRPQATALAAGGVAVARPVATAIAGISPSELGLQFQYRPDDRRPSRLRPAGPIIVDAK